MKRRVVRNSIANSRQELAKTGWQTGSRRMARATQMCIRWENKVNFLTAEALRGVNSTIFGAQGSRIDNELGKRDYVTGTALEQGCDSGKGSRCATTSADGTDAAHGSEAQQSQFIDEIIDITVSAQKQNPRNTEVPQLENPEDHGDSPVAVHRQDGR